MTETSRVLTAGGQAVPRRRFRLVRVLFCVIVAGAVAFLLLRPKVVVPTPEDLSKYDPEIRELIAKTSRDIQWDPDDGALWARLGMIYEINDQVPLAVSCYSEALRRDSGQPRWWYRLAMSRAGANDVPGALQAIDRSLALERRFAPSYWRKGLWLLDIGELAEAERAFREALTIDSDDRVGSFGLARALIAQRRAPEAVAVLEPVVRRWPKDRYAHQLLGTAYRMAGRRDVAATALQSSGTDQTSWPDPWTQELAQWRRGFAAKLRDATRLLEQRRFSDAVGVLEYLHRKKPDDVFVLVFLGSALIETSRVDAGVEKLEHARAMDPDRAEVHANLAAGLRLQGRLDEALRAVSKAIELKPASGFEQEIRGLVLQDMGRYDEAVDSYSRAVALDPSNVSAALRRARLLRVMDRWRDAEEAYERILADHPLTEQALFGLADLHLERGKPTAARAALERAARLNPGHPGLRSAWGRLWRLEAKKSTPGGD